MRLVVISDTHNLHERIDIPAGDVLIHAGDISTRGELADIEAFDRFLAGLPHRHKIVIAGNHDFCFERDPDRARNAIKHAMYLQDEAVTIDGVIFYGSPWQPWFHSWAFNLHRGPDIRAKWSLIPDRVDVLITHGPPLGHGDTTYDGRAVGCEDLLHRIQAIEPRYHLFGHIHEGYGITQAGRTIFVNASTCNLQYSPVNPPVVLDL